MGGIRTARKVKKNRTVDQLISAIKEEPDYISCANAARLAGWVDNGVPDTDRVYYIVFRSSAKSLFEYKKRGGRTLFRIKKEFLTKTEVGKTGKIGKSITGTKIGKQGKIGKQHSGTKIGKKVQPEIQKTVPEENISFNKDENDNGYDGFDNIHYSCFLLDYQGDINIGKKRRNWYVITRRSLKEKLAALAMIEADELEIAYTKPEKKTGIGVIQVGIRRRFRTWREKALTETIVARNLERLLGIIVFNMRYKTRSPIKGHVAKKDEAIERLEDEGIASSRGDRYGSTWHDASDPGHIEAYSEKDLKAHFEARRLFWDDKEPFDRELHNIGPRVREVNRNLIALTHLGITHKQQLHQLTQGLMTTNQLLQGLLSLEHRRVKIEEKLADIAEKFSKGKKQSMFERFVSWLRR